MQLDIVKVLSAMSLALAQQLHESLPAQVGQLVVAELIEQGVKFLAALGTSHRTGRLSVQKYPLGSTLRAQADIFRWMHSSSARRIRPNDFEIEFTGRPNWLASS